MFGLIGAVVIGAVMGWVAENFNFTRLGLFPAITTAIGGAIIAYFIFVFLGIGLYGRAFTSAIGAGIALFLAPRISRR